jgi:hypothetical protein
VLGLNLTEMLKNNIISNPTIVQEKKIHLVLKEEYGY